jgi:hypothetical protein
VDRERLKVSYGEGFGGAPLQDFSPPRRDTAGMRGSRDEPGKTKRSKNVGGKDYV